MKINFKNHFSVGIMPRLLLIFLVGFTFQAEAKVPDPPPIIAGNLLFSSTELNTSSVVNGTVSPVTNTLRTSTGTASGITLEQTAGGAWLTLPTALPTSVNTTGTSLSFQINPTGLAQGVYTATVRANGTNYTSISFNIILRVSATNSAGTTEVKINFAPSNTTPATGWIIGTNTLYAQRIEANQGAGVYTFGWTNFATPVLRNCPSIPVEQRSFMYMDNGIDNYRVWEIAVLNGLYEVEVSAGDGIEPTQAVIHNINVEGTNAINMFAETQALKSCTLARFRKNTVAVYVGDGRLTLDSRGGFSSRINYITIKPATARLISTPSNLQVSAAFGEPAPATSINVMPNFGNASQLTLTKSDNADWLTLPMSYTLGDIPLGIDITGLVVGNYQAIITASSPGYADILILVDLRVLPRTMTFTPTPINLTTFYNQPVASQVAMITGNFDTPLPTVTLTKTAGTPWLTLPLNPVVNQNLTFVFDPTGLPPGLHQATVTASADGYQNATLVFNLTVAPYGLNFSNNTLTFNVIQGQTASSAIRTLSAASGTPSVILSKSAGNSWLIMPTAALGDLSFGVDAGGLAPGIYTVQVLAIAPGYTSANLTVKLIVEPNLTGITWGESFNFHRHGLGSAFVQPTGFKFDNGDSYGTSNGRTPARGWLNPVTNAPLANTRFTNPIVSNAMSDAEKLNNTWNYLNNPINGFYKWEVLLPNETYNALISVGDPTVVSGVHRVNIEGVNAVDDFVPTNDVRQKIGLVTVTITDGRLTLDAGEGGSFTKLNYLRTALAIPANDVIAPTVKVKFNNELQNITNKDSYADQVLIEVEAQDAGGSGLASVEFSLNGAAFQTYTNGLLINEIGNYTIRVRATDGRGNTSITPLTSFKVVRVTKSNAKLGLYNLDRFPANDNLTFSLIQNPFANVGPNLASSHNKVTLRLRNTGSANLRIDNLVFSDASKWKIETLGGGTYNPSVMLPTILAPGQFIDAVVVFIANYPDGQSPPGSRNDRVGVLHETLTIISNDDDESNKSVFLHGLWQRNGEGGNEPTLNEIFDALGLKTATGFSPTKPGNNTAGTQPTGDEIFSANWVRADLNRPVYVRQLAAYHNCCNSGAKISYNKPGVKGGPTIVTHIGLDGQSLLPRSNANGTPAERLFVPAAAFTSPEGRFNFTLVNDATDPTLNLNGWVGVRIFKARDTKGNIIPNAYLMSMDYLSSGSNWDYNDNAFYVENIKPAVGSAHISTLGTSIEEVLYPNKQVGETENMSITLTNLGQNFTPGPNDPSITIQSIKLVGDDLQDFTFTPPSQRTLAATQSTTLNVAFSPKTYGAKKAELLIYYNAGNTELNNYSPVRIPLYGNAETSCISLDFVKRIKSAAQSSSPVTIGGLSWESDVTYRKGSFKIDLNVPPISNTGRDELYSTYLSSTADSRSVQYQIPLTAGKYTVRLHFAENFFDRVGSRVNNIFIENVLRLPGYDIFGDVKYKTAVTKDFEVDVIDGLLDLNFVPIQNRPAICAIEIFRFTENAQAFTLALQSSIPANCSAKDGSLTVLGSGVTNIVYKLGEFGIYQSNGAFSGLEAGEYRLYAKDQGSNCEVVETFVLGQANNVVDFSLELTPVSCNSNSDGRAKVTFTGGTAPFNIVWNNNPELTTPTIINLPVANNHTITLTDANGCTKTVVFGIGVSPGCPLRINSGGDLYISSAGRQFSADRNFSGGSTFRQTAIPVTGTLDPTLYTSERIGTNFNYAIPVVNGTYAVILHFAEIRTGINSNGRIFNVDIEGIRRVSNYDMVEQVGAFSALTETLNVTINDNTLNIVFAGSVNSAKIAAIEVIPINVVNVAPVAGTFSNRTVPQNTPFSFSFPANTFTDPGDILTYTARLSNNTVLPSWISFNPSTRTFSTFANVANGTVITVRITAIDSYGVTAFRDFNVTVNTAIAIISNIEVKQNIRPVFIGNNKYIIGVELDAANNTNLQATLFNFNTQGTDKISAISNAKLYYTANNGDFKAVNQFGATQVNPNGDFSFTGTRNLATGINYFWLTYDISSIAVIDDIFDAECISVIVSAETYTPADINPTGTRKIGRLAEKSGNAYDFQGTNNYLAFEGAVSWTPQITIDFWFSPQQNPATEKWIIGEVNGTRIVQIGNILRFYVSNGVGLLQGPATVQIPNFEDADFLWHHVTAVYDGNTIRLFINGKGGTPVTFVGSNAYLGNEIRIGAANPATQNDFLLDELRIWDTALSTTQIRKQMHLTLEGNEPNLRHYLQFEENVDATEINDLVGDTYALRTNPTITNWVVAIEPVGKGISESINVTNAGTYNFINTDLTITFGSIHPQGEIVVTKLINNSPYEAPSDIITTIEQGVNDGRPKTDDYWVVNNFGVQILSPMTLNFQISEVLFNQSVNVNTFWLHKRASNSIGKWQDERRGVNTGGTFNNRFVEFSGTQSFSQFVITKGGSSPLPVSLLSFEAEWLEGTKNLLKWTTVSEQDNRGFEIEKSSDALTFVNIGFVDGAGNSNQLIDYQFIDTEATTSTYYRLKQVDNSGEFAYSNVVFVKSNNSKEWLLYPNPVSMNKVNVLVDESGQKADNILMEVSNMQGVLLLKGKGDIINLEKELNKVLPSLSPGVYVCRFIVNQEIHTLRLVKTE